MKRYMLVVMALVMGAVCYGQNKPKDKSLVSADTALYLKYPKMPSFEILEEDSSTIYNTYNIPLGKPTVLVFFAPDCDHCQMMTKEILEKMDSLKGANFLFFTPMSLAMLKPFAQKNELGKYKNILAVGKEYRYLFPTFYDARYVPIVVVYDRKKLFVKRYEGTVKVTDLISTVRAL